VSVEGAQPGSIDPITRRVAITTKTILFISASSPCLNLLPSPNPLAGLFITHSIHPNLIMLLATSLKFEDSLMFYRMIEQFKEVIWLLSHP
jgi:hypothetical protein